MSASLVESFSSDFDPEAFTDEYQEELRTLIDAKLEKGDALDTSETFGEKAEKEGGEVIDLMEALRASVERSRAARGGGSKTSDGGDAGRSGTKTDAKKSTAKSTAKKDTDEKAPAKKAPAKKPAEKKAPAKKSAKAS